MEPLTPLGHFHHVASLATQHTLLLPEPGLCKLPSLKGTVTGWPSTGRMRLPAARTGRRAYYREAVRLTRAAGRSLRRFRRSLRDAFPPAGRGASREVGPITFHVGGCEYKVKEVSMQWEGKGRRSRPVFTPLGAAEVTWPAT